MRTVRRTSAVAAAIVLVAAQAACAEAVSIGVYSRQEKPSHARIGGSVRVTHRHGGSPGSSGSRGSSGRSSGGSTGTPPAVGGTGQTLQPIPTLSSDAAILKNPAPLGPGSFWFNAGGQRCIYTPGGNGACYYVTGPGTGGPGVPAINPVAMAQSAARRLGLSPGEIVASPSASRAGLTGAPSWFWLDPPPSSESLTVSLGPETVTVTATPAQVGWSFGDGGQAADAGAGRPYRRGDGTEGAVRHRYRTRCLPGDQGHDPYVLGSCTADGYQVEAGVEWTIGYVASGPVAGSGALPSRTTTASIAYPVSEVRGFLTKDGGR